MARAARQALNNPGDASSPALSFPRPQTEPVLVTAHGAHPDNGSNGKPKRHRGNRGGKRHRRAQPAIEEAETRGVTEPPPVPEEPEAKPPRRRGSRGGKRHRRAEPAAAEAPQPEPEPAPPALEPEAKPARRRGSRGGKRHRRAEPAAEAPQPEPEPAPPALEPEAKPARRRGSRGGKRHRRAGEAAAEPAAARRKPVSAKPARAPATRPRSKIPVTGAPTEYVPPPFAHNAEYEFARILDFYGIEWQYEPRSFPLRWEHGHMSEAFTPDFYLPDLSLYVELTTLKAGLTAEKNRKMRLMKELYPEVSIILLKKRDYLRLLQKYGYGAISPDEVPDIHRILITTARLQQRVGELGAQISRDYAGKEPVLIGVLRGVLCFMADLMRQITVTTSIDLMSISSYEGNGAAVRILKDLDGNIKGRDVILVEDIVDTGMTLNHIIDYLNTKRPASIKVCTLLDKRARRLVNVPLDYVGFEIPDEFVVGYGLDFQQRFRNLPFIGLLKHQRLP